MSQVVDFAGLVPLPKCRDDNEAMHIFLVFTCLATGSIASLILDNCHFCFGDL